MRTIIGIKGTKDTIPNSVYSEPGPVLNVCGRDFLLKANTKEETWITWFLPRESKEFYDTCCKLMENDIKFDLGIDLEKSEVSKALDKTIPDGLSNAMLFKKSDIVDSLENS